MKNWTGTVSKTARVFACALAFLALSAGAATVKDIGIKTHYPWNGMVDVTYNLGGAENGSVYRVTASVVAGTKTYANVYTEDVDGSKGYAFQWDAKAAGFTGRVEDAKVVFTVAEPTFVAIDLTSGALSTEYPLTWYFGVEDPNVDLYKTDHLLLKRITAGGMTKYVGLFEVTQRQYELVVGSNPAYYSLYSDATVPAETRQLTEWKRPVERLSYDILVAKEGFIDRLTRRTGLKLALPTKAEWQAAAYGNGDKGFNLGAGKYYDLAANMSLNTWLNPAPFRYGLTGNQVGNRNCGPDKSTAMVGSYDANDLGLYDMHGNVSEWTQTTETDPSDLKTVGVLCGGDYASKAENSSVTSTRTMAQQDGTQYYYTGFRVFGDESDDSFEKEQTIESVTFPIDVDEDNIRQIRVQDNNDGTYTFFYTPEGEQGATERAWVTFDDPATVDGVNWKPTHHGDNVAINEAESTVTTTFRVTPLTIELTAAPVTVTYDGEWHTIEGPDVTVPSYHGTPFKIVYWCADNEAGHAKTENEASENKDDVHFINVKRALDNSVLSYAVWYKVTSPFYNTKAECQQLTINPRAVKNAQVKCKDTLTYNAKLQTNEVTDVSLLLTSPAKTLNLKIGTDYALDGNSGTDAQKYTMTLAGKGNYTGTLTKLWEILPLDFGDIKSDEGGSGTQEKKAAKVNLVSDYHQFVYNGQPQTNYVLSVSINGVDFDPTSGAFDAQRIVDNVKTDVGTYKVVVTGIKNFKGNLTNEWTIVPMSITNATVYLDAEFDYNGDCQTRNVTNVTVATDGYEIPANPPAIATDIVIPSYTIDVPAKWYYVRGNTGTNASAKVGAYTLGVWAKSLANNNFSGHVYTNWFIGQRDLTNAVFTLDDAAAYDYVYNRTGKTPNATAVDAIDDGTHAINPMITEKATDPENDWVITNYLNNVNVGDEAKIVFAATENGNYRGTVTNGFATDVMPATITSVTITNKAAKSFVYDGEEKVVHRGDVLVQTENGLTLRNDAKPYEFKTSGQNKATATGRYKVTVTPQTDNFINSVPDIACDTWEIIPASPTLTWTTAKGATNVTDDAGTIVFGVSDLTVAAISRCAGETLHIEFAETNKQIIVRDNKFHVTERTKITVFSTFDAGDGTVLTGAETTVTLVPGVCADPEIYVQDGWRVGSDKYKFERNNAPVVIKPTETVNGVKVREYPNDPFWPAWNNATSETHRIFYTLLDGMTNVIASAENVDYATEGLKVSADTVFVVAQIRDVAEPPQYLDSIVVTQKLTRVIGDLAAPVITIEKVNAATRRVTMTQADGAAIYYTTSNKVYNAESPILPEALKPTAACETGDVWAAEHAVTKKYEGPFEIKLDQVDEVVDVKAIAYTLTDAAGTDFSARSPVADEKSFREWTIGDALGSPDQVFTNGYSHVQVAPNNDPNPHESNPLCNTNIPWLVVKDDSTAAGNECMRSGPMAEKSNIRTSSISTTVQGPGMLVFNWKANCEDDPTGETWDHGEFIVDGVVTQKIDGVTGWQSVLLMLNGEGVDGNGKHQLTWTYTKDFVKQGESIAEGDDCIYLDSFKYTPASEMSNLYITIEPLVYSGSEQTPVTNTVFGTNYIHALLPFGHPAHPEWGKPYELTEGVDYQVDVAAQSQAGDHPIRLYGLPKSILVSGETNLTWKILPLDISAAVVEYDPTNTVYSGAEQVPAIKHLWAKHHFVGVRDFGGNVGSYTVTDETVAAPGRTDKGNYKIQLVGKANLTGTTAKYDWNILPKPLTDATISIVTLPSRTTENSWFYNRAGQTPEVSVTATSPAAISADDYEVTYLNKADYSTDVTNAGWKVAIVTAKPESNWKGSVTNNYKIMKAQLDRLELFQPTTFAYDEHEHSVSGTVWTTERYGNFKLMPEEWEISGNKATDAGTYTAKATLTEFGAKNFKYKDMDVANAPTAQWEITSPEIKDAKITLGATQTYSGAPLMQTVAIVEVNVEGTMQTVPATDYMVESNVQTNVKLDGDYILQVTITNGNYRGKASKAWNILPKTIAGATITLTTNLVWNGEAEWKFEGETFTRTITTPASDQAMTFGVKDTIATGDTNLVLGADYAIKNASNVGTNAGPYTLVIEGRGNYTNETLGTVWTIAPTLPLVRPNNANPTTNEVYVIAGQTRVSMGADSNDWGIHYEKTTVSSGATETKDVYRTKSVATAVFTLSGTERTKVEAWTFVKGHPEIQSDHVFVDYRTGRAAEPVICFADADNIPNLYVDGAAFTNADGSVVTNFTNNGQHIALTRGNVAVSNLWDGVAVRTVFTNDAENAIYTDGTLRYTLDGTIPTEGSSVWTADTVIQISRTTTVIAKVFGSQYADSRPVTNVFYRETGFYQNPKIEYVEEGSSPENWLEAAHGDTVIFEKVGQKVRISDPLAQGGLIYFTLDGGVTTNKCEVGVTVTNLVFDATTEVKTWIADELDPHNFDPSDEIKVLFSCDTVLATPVIAFSNAVETAVYQKDDEIFTNAWQWIQITRGGDTFTRYTDGEIWYKLDAGDWAKYTSPIKIWTNTTVYAVATNGTSGFAPSPVTNEVFAQEMKVIDAPTVTVEPTITVKQVKFTITRNAGNIVYYTTNGIAPIGLDKTLAKSTDFFTEPSKTFVMDIKEAQSITVKAIAYDEIKSGTDFIGRSIIAVCETNRAWRIGDALRPGVDEEPGSTPSTADLDAHSEIGDGYNHIWTDDDGNEFDTSWVEDTEVAYVTGGKSMRSGDVRAVATDLSTDGTNSVMTAKVYGPGTFRFCWKASTEFEKYDYSNQVYDVCRLYVDGEDTGFYTWGSNDWTFVEYTIEEEDEVAQTHTITWNYIKDGDQYDPEEIGFDYEDCVWVDEFTWTARPMMDQCDVTVAPLTYNQQLQTPTFVVTNRVTKEELVQGVDFAVADLVATNLVGTYNFVIKGLGTSYTGTQTVYWTISPLSIDGAIVTLSADMTYNQSNQFVTVESIQVGTLDVVGDVSWTATGTNATEVGEYWAVITGDDNLTGVASNKWSIGPKAITADMITVPTDIVYFGGATNVTANSDTFKVAWRGEDIVCTYVGEIATNAGTYTITVTAVENETLKDYTGSASKEWKINPYTLNQDVDNLVLTQTHFTYNGSAQTTDVSRVIAQHPVFGEIDFSNDTWTVSGNIATDMGTYWVVLTPGDGGSYTNFTGGPISNSWTIGTYIADIDVTFGPWPVYQGGATELEPTITSVTTVPGGLELVAGRDYTVEYASKDLQNRKYALKGTLTIVGQGNFAGLRKEGVEYQILPEQILNTTIDLADWSYVYDGSEKVPGITMTLPNGKIVYMDQAPQKGGKKIGGWMIKDGSQTNGTDVGSYQIDLAGYYDYTETHVTPYTGNINGETNVTWEIKKLNLADATVTLSAETFVYNRQIQQPTVTVTYNGKTIPTDDIVLDFEGLDCSNACDAITFKVKGSGVNVTNAVEKTYAITPAEITAMKFNAQPGVYTKPTYNGANQSVKPAVIKAGNMTLNATEYAISESNKTAVGEYTSVVRSISPNFADPSSEISDKWWITAKPITEGEVLVSFAKHIYYTGANQEITAGDVTQVTCAGLTLASGEYSFAVNKQVNVGEYWTKMTASGNFTDEKDIKWNIEARDITGATAIEFEKDRLDWNGQEMAPVLKSITVPDVNGGDPITFTGTQLADLTVDNAQTEAGFYESTVSGTGNFTGTTTLKQSWGIVPGRPKITPNDGAGTYTKLADWVTVEINNSPDTAPWQIFYTTNDWVDTKPYTLKGGKFDITQHMVVKAYAVSLDNCITGETATCEYFFGARNKAPTIGLTALAGAEEGRPASYEGTEVKGEAKLVVKGTDMVTNFYHSGTKVYLTRFGTWDQATIDAEVEKATTDKGVCPLTDGKIYYTIAENGAPIVAPDTNDVTNTKWFNPADSETWPTFSTNAVIVAQVFGDQLESSAPVTNSFQRLFAQIPAPTIKPDVLDFHFCLTNSIVTNAYVGADWTVTNELQKIFITLDETDPTASATRFLYTNEFEVTWANTNAEGKVVVKAVATREGEGYQNSSVVTKEYLFLTDRFATPTMTPATTFRHWKSEDPLKNDGFQVFITNNAPLGVGGNLMYSINGVEYPTPGDVGTYSDIYLFNTTTVRVWVATTDAAHNYKPSLTNEAIYTYLPYKMVAPTNDTPSQVFSTDTITFTVSNLTAVASVNDHAHIYNGTLMYSYDQGGTWRAAAGNSMTVTTNETTEIWIKQVREDHLDSDIVSNKYTRSVIAPAFKLLKWDSDELAETNLVNGVTNFYHNSRLQIIYPIGTTLTYTSDIQDYESGTYTGPIPVKDTFTLTAKATTQGGSVSEEITVHYNRVWDTLAKAKVELTRPDGVLTNEFRNTADSVAITNDVADLENRIVLWPTNVVVKYAIVPNSTDTETFPTAATFAEFEQGVTKQYFKADTNVVWAIATAEDYLPSTNAVKFVRVLDPVEKPVIHFDNEGHRRTVNVTFDMPAGANEIYYTYDWTNVAADVADPVGDEYDYTKCTNRYTGMFQVAVEPEQTLVVKARAYFEDGTSSLVAGFMETNFTARSAVACDSFTLPWTYGDALDAPDQAFEAYSEPYKAANTNVVRDTVVKNYGDSSIVFKELADGEWASIETTVTGPGTVIFDWKSSCESHEHDFRDHFAFVVDGTVVLRIDGNTDWTTVTNYIGSSTEFATTPHTLTWRYRKDASEKQLDDSAWLDHFRWIPSDEGIEYDEELDNWLYTTAGSDYLTLINPDGTFNASACTAYLANTAENGRSYYECYLLGLDVEDPDSEFSVVDTAFQFEDDPRNPGQQVMTKVTLSWTPIAKKGRVYSLVGMKDLWTDESWTILNETTFEADTTDADKCKISASTSYIEGYHFFEIRVRMAK